MTREKKKKTIDCYYLIMDRNVDDWETNGELLPGG